MGDARVCCRARDAQLRWCSRSSCHGAVTADAATATTVTADAATATAVIADAATATMVTAKATAVTTAAHSFA